MKRALKKAVGLCMITIACTFSKLHAADTLRVTLQQADSLFIANNLLLIAEGFNVEAAKALEIAARAYPNPIFTVDLNIYDPQNSRVFHVGNTGQKQFTLEQLIPIGGKRKTEIDIAKKNTELAKLEFEDFLRSLYFEVHSSFFRLNQQYRTIQLYDEQLVLLDTLIKLYDVQVQKDNIPLKDLIRLKSIFLKFNNERSEVFNQYIEETKNMQLFLHTSSNVVPVFDNNQFAKYANPPILDSLLSWAFTARPDYRLSDGQTQLAALELKYQRKQVIPDIKLNFSYDQRGGAFINQFNGGFTIPLPLWSFNRGQVKFAEANVKIAEVYFQIKKEEIEIQVGEAYANMLIAMAEYTKMQNLYNDDFNTVYAGVKDNFSRRNISIIEFADFMESYNETITEIEQIKAKLAITAHKINFVTATNRY